MAGEWKTVLLGDLAAAADGAVAIGPFGSAIKADVYSETGVPVIRGTNISEGRKWKGDWVYIPEKFADQMPRCVVNAGDIVFPHRGSIGEVALIPKDNNARYFLSSSMMKITLDPSQADPRYVYLFFKSPAGRDEVLKYASQVGTPGIGQPLTSLRQFRLPLPPIGIQRAIADLLGALDDKIELNWRMAETLEAAARALFKSWFVDFDPVRAKSEGRAMSAIDGFAALFPRTLGTKGLPEGWGTEPLLSRCKVVSGGTPKTDVPEYWDGPIEWASAKDVSQCPGAFLIETERTISERGLNESASRLVPRWATAIVARGATTGRFCMFSREMAMNQTCYALTSDDTPFWLNCALAELLPRLVQAGHGSVFNTITTETLRTAHVVGDVQAARAFEEVVRPLFVRLLTCLEQSAALAALRDTLLPRLVSGELRIRDAESKIEAA